MKSRLDNCLVLVSGMTSIFCQMVSVQIWTQPALISKWSMSSLQSVPFLTLGDLSKISWLDDLLYSWHQGINYYHYNIVLCSAGWESKLNMPWLCHPCQMSRRLPLLPHTVLFTQPSQKITSSRIFYFNHYLLIKNLSKKFCQFLKETFQDLQSCHFSFNTVFPPNGILYQPIN